MNSCKRFLLNTWINNGIPKNSAHTMHPLLVKELTIRIKRRTTITQTTYTTERNHVEMLLLFGMNQRRISKNTTLMMTTIVETVYVENDSTNPIDNDMGPMQPKPEYLQ